MAAVVADEAVVHHGWSGADQAPAELQVNRARACVLKAASKFTIGPQRLATNADGLSHQAQRSQAEENPDSAYSLADFHISSFGPELHSALPARANIPQITLGCVHSLSQIG